jgi:MFS family permease
MIRAGSNPVIEPLRFPAMDRSLRAVLAGTFTLRFSTGLTGAMYSLYLADLAAHGGTRIGPEVVGLFAALFFVSELLLSPVFGILSDRLGHHRVMLYGPVFGGVAAVLTGLTVSLPILGVTRLLEGASTAASVPSILGFIALATAGNEVLRGKAAARFEGATLAGLGVGFIVAPKLFEAIGPTAFFLNAGIYGISFLIYWLGVTDPEGEREAVASTHVGFDRYFQLVRSAHVLLLAPTWIAVNASIGLWFSQSLFQFSKANPKFPGQLLMRGYDATQITVAAIVIAIVFGLGLLYWGNRFKNMRRTTIILYGIFGGGVLVAGGMILNHSAGVVVAVPVAASIVAGVGLFVLAGATPAALGLLADISERFPADRGAIMGLYSVFLAIGQISGSLIGGFAAAWHGIDGMLLATLCLLAVALLPLARLRSQEHEIGGPGSVALIGELDG